MPIHEVIEFKFKPLVYNETNHKITTLGGAYGIKAKCGHHNVAVTMLKLLGLQYSLTLAIFLVGTKALFGMPKQFDKGCW